MAGAASGSGRRFPSGVDLTIALGEFFFQQSQLFLLGLKSLAQLFNLNSDSGIGLVGRSGFLSLGRLRVVRGLGVGILGRISKRYSGCQE